MPFELNDKIKNLVPYDPIMGDYPIRLDANESFLPMVGEERMGLEAALAAVNLRRYPDPAARKLCQAAAAFYGTKPKLVTAFNGTDEALLLLCCAFLAQGTVFLGQGNTLLCYETDFSMYRFYAYLSGAEIVKLPKRADFTIDTDAAIEALQKYRPQMFLFSNPCNPTSLVLPMEDVRRVVLAAQEIGTLLALDEAYMDFNTQSLLDEVERHPNLVILRTCSKAAGLAGLRLGFSIANTDITRVMHAVKSPYNVGVLTQAIGVELLSQPYRLVQDIQAIRQSTDALSAGLRALGLHVIGDGANFVFAGDCGQYFEPLKARGIVVRRFGENLRITAGTEQENAALLNALKELITPPVTA